MRHTNVFLTVVCNLLILASQAHAQSDKVAEKLGNVSSQLSTEREKFAAVKSELDIARDREIRIKNILAADYDVACRGVAKIEKIEVKVTGDHLPIDQQIDYGSLGGPLGDRGNPRSFKVTMGDELVFTHSNEETFSAFVPAGGIIPGILPEGLKGARVRDIEKIVITKLGASWKHDRRDWGCLFGCMVSENREQNMYRMDSIAIAVNGVPFYYKSGVEFTFRNGNFTWSDPQMRGNEVYKKYFQTQCN